MTPTEAFIANLCKITFLSFWSFPNPIGKKGKELCDLLVVCDPDIIIFSVKEIIVNDSGDINIDTDRWQRKAIDASAAQIYGAERILTLGDNVLLSDGVTRIPVPLLDHRNIYRVAVAFGRGDKFPMQYGDLGKGFVHAFDERSIEIVLRELDTITDFIGFLKAQEEFARRRVTVLSVSAEDFLAMYLQYWHEIPESADLIQLDDDLWNGYSESDEYKIEKTLAKEGYLWDAIIESLSEDFNKNQLLNEVSRNELEIAIRVMNREGRYSRRQFSNMIREVWGNGKDEPKIKARLARMDEKGAQTYVFMKSSKDRELCRKELLLRCMVARSIYKDSRSVLGLLSEPFKKGAGYAIDVCYIDYPEWTKELEEGAKGIQADLGYFSGFKPIGSL